MIVKDAELLRRLMKASGVTARQLARDLGWSSHSYVNRILTGQVVTVRAETAQRVADRLEVPIGLVFGPDGDRGRSR